MLDAELAGRGPRRGLLGPASRPERCGHPRLQLRGQTIDRFTNTFATDRVRTNNFYLQHHGPVPGAEQAEPVQAGQGSTTPRPRKGRGRGALNDMRSGLVQALPGCAGPARTHQGERSTGGQHTRTDRTDRSLGGSWSHWHGPNCLTLRSQLAQEEYDTDVRNQHDQALLALGRAMQLELQESSAFDIVAPAIDGLSSRRSPWQRGTGAAERAGERTPAYKRTKLNVESAERSIAIARAGGIPSLQFSANVAVRDTPGATTGEWGTHRGFTHYPLGATSQ